VVLNGCDDGAGAAAPPVIGMTTYLQQAQTGVWDVQASFLPAIYFQGVNLAGGTAVLLPPQPVDSGAAARVLDGIDGLIITGGKDVDPARYGQRPHPTSDEPDRVRDAWEFALLDEALRRGVPVLGICRGAQVLNVALGGTLIQHLPDVIGHTHHQKGNAVFGTSAVWTEPGTRLADLIGKTSDAQCYHHQAIDRVGEGLIVSARDDDGVIEAVELDRSSHPDHWVVGVQWHPEERLDDLRLFAAVVAAASQYAMERTRT
jgi:putative glutamine amidotransferase